jgi:hypothetical protein
MRSSSMTSLRNGAGFQHGGREVELTPGAPPWPLCSRHWSPHLLMGSRRLFISSAISLSIT